MVSAKEVILQFLILILIKTNVNAATLSDNPWGLLSKLFGKNSNSPLIVVIASPPNDHTSIHQLRTSDDQNYDNSVDQKIRDLDETIDAKKTMQYVGDILRSTGDDNDPNVKETNMRFENALRSRCEKYLECQLKCRKPKKKNKCQNSCQKIYDRLNMCKQKKKKDPCAGSDEYDEYTCGKKFTIPCDSPKCGRTLPPDW